jgi:hypothetical protein
MSGVRWRSESDWLGQVEGGLLGGLLPSSILAETRFSWGGVGRRGGNSRQAGLKFSFKEIVVFDEKLFRSKYIVVHCGIGMFFLLSEGGLYPGMIKDGRFGRVL